MAVEIQNDVKTRTEAGLDTEVERTRVGGVGQKETRELGTSLAGLGVAGREEFIVKTGWEGPNCHGDVTQPTRNSSETCVEQWFQPCFIQQEGTLKMYEAGSP